MGGRKAIRILSLGVDGGVFSFSHRLRERSYDTLYIVAELAPEAA
jgi:hypothetical protein